MDANDFLAVGFWLALVFGFIGFYFVMEKVRKKRENRKRK